MKEQIDDNLKELLNKDCLSISELKENIINIFRTFSMNKHSTALATSFAITDDVKFFETPLRMDVIKSPLGPMMMKSFIKDYNKKHEDKIVNVIELLFGVGIKRRDDQTKADFELIGKRIKSRLEEKIKSNESHDEFIKDVLSMEDMEEYMILNEYSPDGVTLKTFEVIRGTDPRTGRKEDYFLISNKPSLDTDETESEEEKKNENIENYF